MRIAIAWLVSVISMQAQIPQPADFDGWGESRNCFIARRPESRGSQYVRARHEFET
jgi:hypothetical protein